MPRLSYTPFGRGSVLTKTQVQGLYDSLATLLNSTKVSNDNFAADAGVPETFFQFYGPLEQTHKHADGSLGTGVISSVSLNQHKDSRRVQWWETQCAGVLFLAGNTGAIPITDDGTSIDFASTSVTPTKSFPAGSGVVVFSSTSDEYEKSYYITSVTSSGFTVYTSVALTLLSYFAIGIVPYTSLQVV